MVCGGVDAVTDDPPNPLITIAKQTAYEAKRRAWALEIGLPYPEDGGVQAARTNRDVVKDGEALL